MPRAGNREGDAGTPLEYSSGAPLCRLTATLTATSADACRGGWGVGVVVDRVESAIQGVDGVTLKSESYVGVDAGGDADVGVTQQLLDDDEVDALFQEQGGGRVA